MVSLLFKFSSLFAEQVRAIESEARLSNWLKSYLPITDDNCKMLFDSKVNGIKPGSNLGCFARPLFSGRTP